MRAFWRYGSAMTTYDPKPFLEPALVELVKVIDARSDKMGLTQINPYVLTQWLHAVTEKDVQKAIDTARSRTQHK
jgi:effector-binding domain-containing protein